MDLIAAAEGFMAEVQGGSIPLQIWINWLSLTAGASLIWVLRQPVARVVFIAMLLNVVTMMAAYDQIGMVRLLGAVHFVFMAPAVLYAGQKLRSLPAGEWHTRWVRVFGATWVISLWIDVIDVVRWFLGERGAGF